MYRLLTIIASFLRHSLFLRWFVDFLEELFLDHRDRHSDSMFLRSGAMSCVCSLGLVGVCLSLVCFSLVWVWSGVGGLNRQRGWLDE